MKFLVPNYSCLQNPWLGGYRPQISVLSVLNWICWTARPEQNSWVRQWSALTGRLQLSKYIHCADCCDSYERPFCAESGVISVHRYKKYLAGGVLQKSVPTLKVKYLPNLHSGIHDALYVLTKLTWYHVILFTVWNKRPAHKTALYDVSPHSLVNLTGVSEGSAAMSTSHLAKKYTLPCMSPCMLINPLGPELFFEFQHILYIKCE